MSQKKISRRDFVKGGAAAGAGLALGGGLVYGRRALAELLGAGQGDVDGAMRDVKLGQMSEAEAQAVVEEYMMSGPGRPRVVHVHAPGATSWDFGDDYYGNFVDQNVVNAMMDQGVMELTGASTVAEAWQFIIPSYTPGQTKIAIKANFNNCWYCDMCRENCDDWQLRTDALIHPLNALLRGLLLAFPALNLGDIWIYDATVGDNPEVSTRRIPARFKDGCLYTGVRFFDPAVQYPCQGTERAGYDSTDPTAVITWHNPPGIPTPPTVKVTDVLVNATYVINMPIIKKHGGAEVTLSFKNHAGSISNFAPFHDWVYYSGSNYSPDYNPLVDIYRNPHIQGKTILTIADGLFGNWERNETKSQRWLTFGNQAANSLFFSIDPVALDCVMCDLLNAENVAQGNGSLRDMADDYLVLAAEAGLGTYERGDPWGSGYNQIEYVPIEL